MLILDVSFVIKILQTEWIERGSEGKVKARFVLEIGFTFSIFDTDVYDCMSKVCDFDYKLTSLKRRSWTESGSIGAVTSEEEEEEEEEDEEEKVDEKDENNSSSVFRIRLRLLLCKHQFAVDIASSVLFSSHIWVEDVDKEEEEDEEEE